MTDKERTPRQKGKNKSIGSTKVSRGWGLTHRLMAKAQNFRIKLKMNAGDLKVIRQLKVGKTKGNVRTYVQHRKFEIGYRLKRTPWGEGPQVISLRNAEPRCVQ